MMKKVLSLLLVVMMMTSFVATTAFAASGNVRVSLDKSTYAPGDTIIATIDSLEKNTSTEGFNLAYDSTKVTYSTIEYKSGDTYKTLTRPGNLTLTRWYGEDDEESVSFTIAEHNAKDHCVAFGFAGTDSTKILAKSDLVRIKFTVNAAATGSIVFTLNENSAGGSRYKGVADTKTATVAAAKDETINTDPTTTEDATEGTKTWNVTVGKDFTGSTLKATLTNSAAAEGNKTQDVTLTLPADISGDASFVFDVNVKFQNFANAATTTLAVSAN